jgi:hypothetical protein
MPEHGEVEATPTIGAAMPAFDVPATLGCSGQGKRPGESSLASAACRAT